MKVFAQESEATEPVEIAQCEDYSVSVDMPSGRSILQGAGARVPPSMSQDLEIVLRGVKWPAPNPGVRIDENGMTVTGTFGTIGTFPQAFVPNSEKIRADNAEIVIVALVKMLGGAVIISNEEMAIAYELYLQNKLEAIKQDDPPLFIMKVETE